MTSNVTSILRSALVALAAHARSRARRAPAAAQTTKLKLVLNWKYQGPQGMFFLADDKGYFKAEGLEGHARPGQRLGRRRAAGRQRHL